MEKFDGFESDLLEALKQGVPLDLTVILERGWEKARVDLLTREMIVEERSGKLKLTQKALNAMAARDNERARAVLTDWFVEQYCSIEDLKKVFDDEGLSEFAPAALEKAANYLKECEEKGRKLALLQEANRIKTFSRLIFGNQDSVQAELSAILVLPQVEYVNHTQSITDKYALITLIYKAKSEVK